MQDGPALGAGDRHIYLLWDIDNKNGQFLHHWLRAVRSAAKKESLRRKKEEQAKIIRFMRSLRTRQRRRNPCTLSQPPITAYFTSRSDGTPPQPRYRRQQVMDTGPCIADSGASALHELHESVANLHDK